MGSFSYISHAVICYCCCFNLGSFSYTSRAGCIFMHGVSLTHPILALFLSREFFLHIPCWLFFFFFFFFLLFWGGGEFLLQIPCWLYFSVGTFSYISHDDFYMMTFTHPVLSLIVCGELSYTSHAGVTII